MFFFLIWATVRQAPIGWQLTWEPIWGVDVYCFGLRSILNNNYCCSSLQELPPSGRALWWSKTDRVLQVSEFYEKILEKQQFNPLWQNRIQTKRREENLSIFIFWTVTFGWPKLLFTAFHKSSFADFFVSKQEVLFQDIFCALSVNRANSILHFIRRWIS